MSSKVTIRQCTDPATLYHVFVGNWAFPSFDFGFHEIREARRIKQFYDQGDLHKAILVAVHD